jgi:hypothetical protein
MRIAKWALPALSVLCCGMVAAPVAAEAAVYVLGDSIGEGVAQIARKDQAKGLAKISIHIRGPKALQQFAQTPPGSTAVLVLGTNDAEGSIAKLDKYIEGIVSAAQQKHITLIWLGPPCVRKSWDSRARELDAMLREKLAGTPVRYVTMRDEALCSGAFHEPDGVHLKMKGYAHMWERARSAAGFAVASAADGADATGTVASQASAVKKSERIPLPLPRRPLPEPAN